MSSESIAIWNEPGSIIPIETGLSFLDEPEEEEEERNPFYSSEYSDKIRSVTLSEIYDLKPTDDLPIIDGLLFPGAYILAGAPKIGKSFLAAQIAFHVSRGIDLFGHKTRQAEVLYLALEDSPARLQRRFGTMFGYQESKALHLAVHAGCIEGNLMDQLKAFLEEHPALKLIIIDTLVMIKQQEETQFSYTNDYKLIGKIKQLADCCGICILMIHHTRKMKDQDQFNMISGTNGLFGAADGAWVMLKENRNDKEATLLITGRDQRDLKMTLTQDSKSLVWTLNKEDSEDEKTISDPVITKVGEYFSGGIWRSWSGTATELKELLKLEDIPVNTITKRLNAYCHLLKRNYGIQYDYKRSNTGRIIKLTVLYENDKTKPVVCSGSGDSCDSL